MEVVEAEKLTKRELGKRAAEWHEMTTAVLTNLYTYPVALTLISERYFVGYDVLFPDFTEAVAVYISEAEEIVAEANNDQDPQQKPEGRRSMWRPSENQCAQVQKDWLKK